MDRLAQTALSALRQMQDNKFDLANNLANVNVPGFRRDLPNEGNAGFLKELEKLSDSCKGDYWNKALDGRPHLMDDWTFQIAKQWSALLPPKVLFQIKLPEASSFKSA